MKSGTLKTRFILIVAAMMAVLSTGALGVIHRHAEHSHGVAVTGHDHEHSCHHDHGSPDTPVPPTDHGHDEGGCELCLMLAAIGRWELPVVGESLGLTANHEPVPLEAQSVIDSRVLRTRSARGPPMLGV